MKIPCSCDEFSCDAVLHISQSRETRLFRVMVVNGIHNSCWVYLSREQLARLGKDLTGMAARNNSIGRK